MSDKSHVVELTMVCPHCHVPGKAQEAEVRNSDTGIGWVIGAPGSRTDYEWRGIVKCEACERNFAYRLMAVPRLEVSAIEWQS